MLVLTRAKGENTKLVIAPSDKERVVDVRVLDVHGDYVRIGFDGERSIKIFRQEVYERDGH